MNTSTSALLPVTIATIGALGGCEWIAGIENTTIGVDAMRPADAALPADGSMTNRPDGGETDGGAGIPDAAVVRSCPEPCAGDAYADFDGQQGGINGRWRYVEVQTDGRYVDMEYTLLPDASGGWLGTGSGPPTIEFCGAGAPDTRCFELDSSLALTSNGPDGNHPALMWTAETDGSYLITGAWRGSSTAPAIETLVTITHNAGPVQNPVDSQQFPLTATAHPFDRDVELAAGDNIVVSVQPVEDGSVSVGVEFFISFF